MSKEYRDLIDYYYLLLCDVFYTFTFIIRTRFFFTKRLHWAVKVIKVIFLIETYMQLKHWFTNLLYFIFSCSFCVVLILILPCINESYFIAKKTVYFLMYHLLWFEKKDKSNQWLEFYPLSIQIYCLKGFKHDWSSEFSNFFYYIFF